MDCKVEQTLPEIHVEDPSGEVFWTRWVDGDKTTVMLLNTDWSTKGNVKSVTPAASGKKHPISIQERTAVLATVCGDCVSVETVHP